MEWKRILGEKKLFLFLGLLFIINLLLFSSEQMKHSSVGDVWTYKEKKEQLQELTKNTKMNLEEEQQEQILFYQSQAQGYREKYKDTKKVVWGIKSVKNNI